MKGFGSALWFSRYSINAGATLTPAFALFSDARALRAPGLLVPIPMSVAMVLPIRTAVIIGSCVGPIWVVAVVSVIAVAGSADTELNAGIQK
jgi:hypothetical protein